MILQAFLIVAELAFRILKPRRLDFPLLGFTVASVPIYEYKCRDQGHLFEVIQKISEPPVEICETCKSPVDRLISKSSFQLKGSGWYVSDYGKAAPPPASESKPATEVKAEPTIIKSTGETKTEGSTPSTSSTDKKSN